MLINALVDVTKKEAMYLESRIRKLKTGCWIYPADQYNMSVYGKVDYRGSTLVASRFAYMLYRGPIPKGMLVCHNCPGRDRPACVNPDHLWLGTPDANSKDAKAKGSFKTGAESWSATHLDRIARGDANGSRKHPELLARGEANNKAVLTAAQILDIRLLRENGATTTALGRQFGVSGVQISNICRGKAWRHVSDAPVIPAYVYRPRPWSAGDNNPSRKHPERVRRGANHPWALHPEWVRRGVDNGAAKKHGFVEDDIRRIRAMYDSGTPLAAIARMYEVPYMTAVNIAKRNSWKHVK